MMNASAIASAGHAIGQGIRDRKKNKNERASITTRLGTLDEFKERVDEFEEMSLGDLRGLEESVVMKRAKQVEDEKRKTNELRQQQIAQMLEHQKAQESRAQANHVLQSQLGEKQLGAFDVNQDMKAEQHQANMKKLAAQLNPTLNPVEEILPGIHRAPLGNGNFQNIDLRPKATEQPGFTPITLPDGSTAYNPSKGVNVNSLLNKEGQKLFASAGNDLSALIAMLGGNAPQGKPASQPSAAGPQEGQVITQGGKRYRFKGGDPKDPKNYEAL